jgi:peptidoglycan hydrolase-like protein with peptidoglycan-binding domain
MSSRIKVRVAGVPASGQSAQLPPQNLRELDMNTVPNLNENNIRQVQQELRKKGLDPGPIDGILGPRTKETVRNFQDRYGVKASGDINNQTLFALGAVELARPKGQ